MGLIAIPPLFWNLPTAIVGCVSTLTGGPGAAMLFLAATMLVAAAMVLLIPGRLVNR